MVGAAGGVEQFKALEQLLAAPLGARTRLSVEAPDHRQVLQSGEVFVDRRVLPGEADLLAQPRGVAHDVEAGYASGARIGPQQRGENPDDRRLAGAVGTEQPEHGSGGGIEIDAREGLHAAVGLLQAAHADGRVSSSAHARCP